MKRIVYLLPHQDDEVFLIPKIRSDLALAEQVLFFFLTESHLSEQLTERRIKESQCFLKHLKVEESQIYNIGKILHIADGKLHQSLNAATALIKEILLKTSNEQEAQITLVSPAFEGGHQDHDAAFVLAQRLNQKWPGPLLEYFMYHGYGTRGKMYKVAAPLSAQAVVKFKYKIEDYWLLLRVPLFYPSQGKAMLGLWPFLLMKSLYQPLTFRLSERGQHLEHEEVPMYERWGRLTYGEFMLEVKKP